MPDRTINHFPFQKNQLTVISLILVGALVLAGFWLRVNFWLAQVYHVDEYISMLAATMVAQRGLPILPSGMFYDHGLLQTLLSGLFVALFHFSEEIARWPTLPVGVLTIAVYYAMGRTIFGSRSTGIIAATLITLDVLAIQWSGRARMYALAHLFVLLTITWLLRSFFQSPNERGRYICLLFLGGALLSHTVTFTILLPLAILILVFSWLYDRTWLGQPRIWLQVMLGVLLLGIVLLIVREGQTSSTIGLQSDAAESSLAGAGFLGRFFAPGLAWSRFDDLIYFFFEFPYNWLLFLGTLGTLTVIIRFIQKRAQFADWAFLFLALYIILIVFEMGGLLASNWQKTRYLFMLNLPAFLLVSAESLNRLLTLITRRLAQTVQQTQYSYWKFVPLSVGVLFVILLMGPDAYKIAHAQNTGDYNTAFEFVGQQWQDGDKVITVHPAAAYLYLGHNDYYANQSTAKVLADEEEIDLIDRYTGAPLIDSAEQLNTVLAQEKRVWFVVDNKRLSSRYEHLFTQQIFSQMNHVRQFGQVYVFLSEPFPRPLPATPDVSLEAQFDPFIRLAGYSLNWNTLAPDGTLPLHLYWRPLEFPRQSYKVFVQLRDAQNQTIAQADHFLLENLLTNREWRDLKENKELLRETSLLQLPLPLPPEQDGPYQLFIGLYDPETFKRVPLRNDISGENAVMIPFPLP